MTARPAPTTPQAGRPVPVLHTRMIISAPESLPLKRQVRMLPNASANESHADGRVTWTLNHGAIEALHFCQICLREYVSLKIDDHKNIVQGSRFKVQCLEIIFDPKL